MDDYVAGEDLGGLPIGLNGQYSGSWGRLLGPTGQESDSFNAHDRPDKAAMRFERLDNLANGNVLEFDLVQENVAWFGGSGITRCGLDVA